MYKLEIYELLKIRGGSMKNKYFTRESYSPSTEVNFIG